VRTWCLVGISLCSIGCGETESESARGDAGSSETGAPDVTIVDAAEAAEAEAEVEAGALCVARSGSASVTGVSPGGPLQLGYSLFHILGGECGGFTIVLLPSGTVPSHDPYSWPLPNVTLYVQAQLDASALLPAAVSVRTASDEHSVDGNVELKQAPPGTVIGNVSVDDGSSGVELSGEFQAEYCEPLNVYCP
jgi:hypothetical protein